MKFKFVCDDRVGIAVDALQLIRAYGLNLQGIEVDPAGYMYIATPDRPFEDVQPLMAEMRRIEGVHDVSIVDWLPVEVSQHSLEVLLETLGVAILRLDPKGVVLQINSSAMAQLGLPERAIGSCISEWVPKLRVDTNEQPRLIELGESLTATITPLHTQEVLTGWWVAVTDVAEKPQAGTVDFDQWLQLSLPEASESFERHYLEHLLPLFKSTRALARRVGISHTAVAKKMNKLGLTFKDGY